MTGRNSFGMSSPNSPSTPDPQVGDTNRRKFFAKGFSCLLGAGAALYTILTYKAPTIKFEDGLTPEECAKFGLKINDNSIVWKTAATTNSVEFPSPLTRITISREGRGIAMEVTYLPFNPDSLPHKQTFHFEITNEK